MVSFFQVQLVMFHASPGLAMYRLKQKWGTREDDHHTSLCSFIGSGTRPSWIWKSPAEQRVVGAGIWRWQWWIQNEDTLGFVPCGFLVSLKCLDHFPFDPAIVPINATGHHLVTLRRSICAEERAKISDPLKGSKYLTTYFIAFVVILSSLYFLVRRIRCRSPAFGTWYCTFGRHVGDTSDTSADESEPSHPRWRVRSKRTYKMKKVWGADEVGRFFATGATDAAGKPSYFYCRICRKDASVLTHGPHEVQGHFYRVKNFARDQRLRLERRGWRVLDFEGNPFSESELERRRKFIFRGPPIIRDREYPFCWGSDCGWFWSNGCHVISPRQGLGRWLKCSDWAAPTRWFTNCGRKSHWLPAESTLTWYGPAMRCWLVLSSSMYLRIHVHWLIGAVFQSIILNGLYPSILFRVFGWLKARAQCSIEFEERGSEIWVMVRTWEKSTFRRVCVAVLSRFSANTTLESTILAKILDAAGPGTSVVPLHGCPHVLAEAFASYLGSGYRAKLVEYPTFDLRLLKCCLQRTAASMFGRPDPFSMTEFVINRLKGVETRDWMSSHPALLKAIITNDLSMPDLVDVVATIVGLWPLVVSYLKETGREDDGDSLVVRSSTLGVLSASCNYTHYFFALLEERDERVSVPQSACWHEIQAVSSSAGNL